MTLKDYILNNIGQVEIFSEYLGVSEDDIRFSITHKAKIKSPFHRDSDPSLSFRYYGSKLICRDFSNIEYSGDIFEIVGKCLHKDCTDKKQFVEICKDIIDTSISGRYTKHMPIRIDETESIAEPTTIEIISRHLNVKDFRYYYQYFIPNEVVKNSYIPVRTYSINGIASKYYHSAGDPCYAYVNNPSCLKLYFPLRKKNEKRFISNNRFPVELISSLSKKDYTVLIKAYKDKLLMDYVCELLSIDNIQFLPVASESARLPEDVIGLLKRHTNKRLFTMFDIDKCGIDSSFYYRTKHGFGNIFLADSHSTKDPTDLIRSIKLDPFLKRFFNIYKTF